MTAEYEKKDDRPDKRPWDAVWDSLRGVHTRLDDVVERLERQYALLRDVLDQTSTENGVSEYDLFGENGWDELY